MVYALLSFGNDGEKCASRSAIENQRAGNGDGKRRRTDFGRPWGGRGHRNRTVSDDRWRPINGPPGLGGVESARRADGRRLRNVIWLRCCCCCCCSLGRVLFRVVCRRRTVPFPKPSRRQTERFRPRRIYHVCLRSLSGTPVPSTRDTRRRPENGTGTSVRVRYRINSSPCHRTCAVPQPRPPPVPRRPNEIEI